MDRPVLNICVLGAGSWGTALAMLLADNGYPVSLWAHHADHADKMAAQRTNERYLPGIAFPDNLAVSADLQQVVSQSDTILIVVPSHAFRATLVAIKPLLGAQHRVVWGTKGLEPDSQKLLHQQAREELGEQISLAVVSGPTFAKEVALKQPGAVTVASRDQQFANDVAMALHNDHFRAYTSDDVVGVEIGGAAKNVMAIAAGVADGLGFGANTRAALIARGLAEISRLGVALGGQQETFIGLTGLGDLVLTCTDNQSRNRRFGLAMGKGENREQAVADIGQVVEGINTAKEIYGLAQQHQVDMPITEQVYKVLYENLPPKQAVHNLFNREPKPEI
ncbi:MAG: NAD(P)H-dependent glycerol-3-phosphate dehydrogenase [Thioalkalispiraceae bacterium]|jgi:glycerol-3-phosphate dehydrogenase (NAD(P)+)